MNQGLRYALMLFLVAVVAACFPHASDTGPRAIRALQAPSTGIITSGPFRLRYQIEGTGKPAVVIGSAVYLPRAFSQELRQHLNLAFLDHRGYALSSSPVEPSAFTRDTILDDIEHARRELRLGRIVVIGHSVHALMALEYAKRYPENVSHVVMIGISPGFSAENDRLKDEYWEAFASPKRKAAMEENLRRVPDELLSKLPPGERFIRTYLRNGPRTWFDETFDASSLWSGVEMNDAYTRAQPFRAVDVTAGLDTFDVPVFLALGRYDFLMPPPTVWNAVGPKFRNLTIKVFERSGHWPHYEEPALFDAELLRWLKKHE